MALPIQRPEIGAALQKLLGLQGRVQPKLDEFVIPTISVGALDLGSAPPVVRKAVVSINESAVALQRFVGRFEAVPGTICVLRKINLFSSAGAANFSCRFPGNATTVGPFANLRTSAFTDGRLLAGSGGGAQGPSGRVTTGTQAATLGAMTFQVRIPADGLSYDIPGNGWVIGNGLIEGFMDFQIALDNSTIQGSIEWDEYALS